MVGQSIRRLIPDDRQQEEDEVLSRIRRGERVEHYETIRRRKDGRLVPVSLTVSPIRSQDGTVVGASKIARDISDRKRAEEERHRLLAIARDASRLKDEFLATLSHELRTPLNAIVGYVRMMQSGLLTGEKQTRALDTVARNVTSLTQIVEDVLDVSRIISGKLRLDLQPVELPPVIQNAVETVRPAADAKGVRLVTIVDPRAAPVSGDPERLQQILWNLLSNAVKFTPRGGRVQVRLERVEFARRDHRQRYRGRHSGGFPAPRLRALPAGGCRHQPRARRARPRPGDHPAPGGAPGRAHFCRERRAGERGRPSGSSCRCASRRPRLRSRNASIRRRRSAGTHIAVPQLQGVRILAVDDDRDALALVREILEATGATVTTADSAQQALEALEHMTPDVLLADLGMPQMNGFDLIDRVRRSERPEIREIPAAALTASRDPRIGPRRCAAASRLHLAKPVDPGELMAAMAALAKRATASK